MALYWYEEYFGIDPPMYQASVLIVLATMAAADWATASQKHQSKSIRDLDISRVTSYFFSVCQFYATAGVLFGVRRYTIQFLNVFVVQLNPFLMTLRRKNLISHYLTVTIYGCMLIFGFTVCVYEYTRFGISMLRTVAAVGNIAILWRTNSVLPFSKSVRNILQNKYLIWTVLGVAVQYLRPLATQEMSFQRRILYTTGMALVILNGYVKCTSPHYSSNDTTDNTQQPVKKFV